MKALFEKYREMAMYLIFGFLAFLVSMGTFALFNKALGMNELIANVLSWLIAVAFAFFTNKTWVFQSKTTGAKEYLKQMASFFGGRIVTLIVEEAIIFIFITMMGLPSMWIKLLAQVVVTILNYIISKLIVFRKK